MSNDELLELSQKRLEARHRTVGGLTAYFASLVICGLIAGLRRTDAGWKQLDTRAIAKAAKAGLEKTAAYQKYEAGGYSLIAREMKQLYQACKQVPSLLQSRPGELERALNTILNRTAEQLEGWTVQAMVDADKNAFAYLVDSYVITVDEIEKELKYIEGLKSRMLAQERGGSVPPVPSHAKAYQSQKDNDDGPDEYDPRFS